MSNPHELSPGELSILWILKQDCPDSACSGDCPVRPQLYSRSGYQSVGRLRDLGLLAMREVGKYRAKVHITAQGREVPDPYEPSPEEQALRKSNFPTRESLQAFARQGLQEKHQAKLDEIAELLEERAAKGEYQIEVTVPREVAPILHTLLSKGDLAWSSGRTHGEGEATFQISWHEDGDPSDPLGAS